MKNDKEKLKIFKTVFLLIIIFSIVGVPLYVKQNLSPVNQNDKTPRVFTVKKGEGLNQIISNLKKAGLVKDEWMFSLLTRSQGLEKRIQAGDFRLNPSMDANAVIQELLHGTLDNWLTIPEGLRTEEIAEKIQVSGFSVTKQDFIASAKNLEGYLFPDTYLIPKTANATDIVTIMTENFKKKLTLKMQDDIRTQGLDTKETVIFASLVEREAKYDEDRPIIAGIFRKRLDEKWPLQVDATVQYIKMSNVKCQMSNMKCEWWTKEITAEDLKIDSPYNTYKYNTLPPGPICNPGLSSIKAVIYPVETDYWFYLSDKKGIMHYGKTMAEHQVNIGKYLE